VPAHHVRPATTGEIAQRYDAYSRRYALQDLLEPVTGLRWLRSRHLAAARGRVLVVAAGTGMDLPALTSARRVVATDISPGMLAVAARRAGRARRGPVVSFALMDATELAMRAGTFDTVVATGSLCTFLEPVEALREMARVCRRDGRVLLLDHGLSDRPWLARRQHRRDARHSRSLGCHLTRQPPLLAATAGLEVVRVRRRVFGTFYQVEAAPATPR
jgi:ubiquinone/menaquinone biosynthesis C-methylase UbiE